MALFFLRVGLELKREILVGELSSLKGAALPMAAALGGMLVPALMYYSFNQGADTAAGWGIPMTTDIAFAVAILVLLAWRIARNLIVFLTALAIADDPGCSSDHRELLRARNRSPCLGQCCGDDGSSYPV